MDLTAATLGNNVQPVSATVPPSTQMSFANTLIQLNDTHAKDAIEQEDVQRCALDLIDTIMTQDGFDSHKDLQQYMEYVERLDLKSHPQLYESNGSWASVQSAWSADSYSNGKAFVHQSLA